MQVNFSINYVKIQNNYVDMQDNCVNIRHKYVGILELKVHISGTVLLLIHYITVNDLLSNCFAILPAPSEQLNVTIFM